MDVATAPRSHNADSPPDLRGIPLRAWLAAHPERAVTWAAVVLLAVQAAVRAVVALSGDFYYDDLVFQGRAALAPFPGPEHLFETYTSQVMPGAFLLVWLVERAAPLQHDVVMVLDLALQAAAGWALFLLLRRMFGATPAVLLPFTVGLFCVVSLEATIWWAAGLNQLPLLLALALALLFFVRHVETGRWRDAVACAGAVLGGLAFSPRAALIGPLLAVLALGWFAEGRPVARVWQALARHWRAWLVLVVVLAPYAVAYVRLVPSPVAGPDSPASLPLDVVVLSLREALLPALAGGPWRWSGDGDFGGIDLPGGVPGAGPALQLLAAVLVAALVLATVVRRRGAGRAWLLLLGAAAVLALQLALTRAPFVGPEAGRSYRYFTELAVVAPLALGLALLPLRVHARNGAVAALVPRRPVPALERLRTEWAPLWAPLRRRPLAAVLLACAVYAGTASWSTLRFAPLWSDNAAGPWLANARVAINEHPQALHADVLVPERVLPPVVGLSARMSRVLAPVAPADRFLVPGGSTEALRVLDDQGLSQQADLAGTRVDQGPVPGCGWPAAGVTAALPLPVPLTDGSWVVRVDYFTTGTTTAVVTAGRQRTEVLLRPGLNQVHTAVEGPVDRVTVTGVPLDVPVCITSALVGVPRPGLGL